MRGLLRGRPTRQHPGPPPWLGANIGAAVGEPLVAPGTTSTTVLPWLAATNAAPPPSHRPEDTGSSPPPGWPPLASAVRPPAPPARSIGDPVLSSDEPAPPPRVGDAAPISPATPIPPAARTTGPPADAAPGWCAGTDEGGNSLQLWLPAAGEAAFTLHTPARAAPSAPVLDGVSRAEAAGFACCFVTDYLSFDEDDPAGRPQALARYYTHPADVRIGWDGLGRQRVESVHPGRSVRTGCGAVIVEVFARVVRYERAQAAAPGPAPATLAPAPPMRVTPHRHPRLGVSALAPCAVPPPSSPRWRPVSTDWMRVAPPVRRAATGALSIDLSLDPAASPHPEPR